MLKKLRLKFICFNMVIVTSMLCIIFGLVLGITRKNLEDQTLQMMRAAAGAPLSPDRPGGHDPRSELPCLILQLGTQGEVVSASGDYYDSSDKIFLQSLADAALSSGQKTGIISKYSLRFCLTGEPSPRSIVFADVSHEEKILKNLLETCLLIGIASFLLFLAVSIFLARWAVRPVDQAWRQQRQFVSDASHELKTPLTVILANAEMLHSPDYDEETHRQFSENILIMAQQMRGLVESLLELARVDNGAAKASMTILNFSTFVANAILPFEPVFFEGDLTISSRTEEGIYIRASEPHMQQLIGILLDNARKYSRPFSDITVRLERMGRNHCVLSVTNPGEEISSSDLKNIFRRFYRIDPARSMNHSYGLGLSIAESIVSCHGGRIWCESQGGINTFFVKLPLWRK